MSASGSALRLEQPLPVATLAVGPPEKPVRMPAPPVTDRLVGLVVKAYASRAEGPEFESRLRRDFFGVESYQ